MQEILSFLYKSKVLLNGTLTVLKMLPFAINCVSLCSTLIKEKKIEKLILSVAIRALLTFLTHRSFI